MKKQVNVKPEKPAADRFTALRMYLLLLAVHLGITWPVSVHLLLADVF